LSKEKKMTKQEREKRNGPAVPPEEYMRVVRERDELKKGAAILEARLMLFRNFIAQLEKNRRLIARTEEIIWELRHPISC
jgi:hypothetical protein